MACRCASLLSSGALLLHRVVFVVGELGVALGGVGAAFRDGRVVLSDHALAVGGQLAERGALGGAGKVSVRGTKLLFEGGEGGAVLGGALLGDGQGAKESGRNGDSEEGWVLGCRSHGGVGVQDRRHGCIFVD